MTSFHPKDIQHRYCGNCHMFHEEMHQMSEDFVRIVTSDAPRPFGEYPIYQISTATARALIASHTAGFFALARPPDAQGEIAPIGHDQWCCVFAHSTWYLVDATVLKVTETGRVQFESGDAATHVIVIETKSPLFPLIEKDQAEHAFRLSELKP